MSNALDDLEELPTAIANEDADFHPTEVAREVDDQSAAEVLAKRELRWSALIPDGLKDSTRYELEASLDAAHYTLGLSQNDLEIRYLTISAEISEKLGLDPADPKVARSSAMRMSRELTNEALAANPWADTPAHVERYFGKYQGYARSCGWSPEQIASTAVDSIVSCAGDKKKASEVFASRVTDELRERGYRGAPSYEALTPVDEKKIDSGRPMVSWSDDAAVTPEQVAYAASQESGDSPAVQATVTPEHAAYADNDMVTIYGADRAEDGSAMPDMVVLAGELRDDVAEREIAGRAADNAVAVLDRIAATTLKEVDYSTYRIMRNEAYRIDKREHGETLAEQVQEQMMYTHRQGADMSIKRVKETLAKAAADMPALADIELTKKAQGRLAATDAEVIAAGIAARPKTPFRGAPPPGGSHEI